MRRERKKIRAGARENFFFFFYTSQVFGLSDDAPIWATKRNYRAQRTHIMAIENPAKERKASTCVVSSTWIQSRWCASTLFKSLANDSIASLFKYKRLKMLLLKQLPSLNKRQQDEMLVAIVYKRQVKRIYRTCAWTIQANIEQFFSILMSSLMDTNIFQQGSLLMETTPSSSFFPSCWANKNDDAPSNVIYIPLLLHTSV